MFTGGTWPRVKAAIKANCAPIVHGRVARVVGILLEAYVPDASIGDVVEVEGPEVTLGEVVGFRDQLVLIIPFGNLQGVAPGTTLRRRLGAADIGVSDALIGRVVDAFGQPIDGGGPILRAHRVPVKKQPPDVFARARVHERFDTGIRTVDALLTCGRGQRIGIFAGAGVGKTMFVRQIVQQCTADVAVIGLVGERGCEVHDLIAQGLPKSSIVVAATSDRSPMERVRGALTSATIAEHFCRMGKSVLLVIDSLTRYAMALREIGLAIGEPPATKGYPPSVFSALPALLERCGSMTAGGSITGFFTVLVEGDDLSDPIADAARSFLDAHIILSRDLADRGQFPAIDVLASASRVQRQVADPAHREMADKMRCLLASRRELDELRAIGAYVLGANPEQDAILKVGQKLNAWMRQSPNEHSTHEHTMATLSALLDSTKDHAQ